MAMRPVSVLIAILHILVAASLFTPASAASGSKDKANCKKPIAAKGIPNLMESVAGLSALRMWSQTAETKHGAGYSMWHNAGGQAVKCERKGNSDFHVCVATGKPCQATTPDKTAKQAR